MAESSIEIVEANLDCAEHARDVVALTAAYALDPMGNGGPLADEVLQRLIPGLKALPTTLIFLALEDVNGVRRGVAIANCFVGFSTFLGRPLINIHDLAVLPEYRGRGIGKQLLQRIEQKALELGCGKLTLEVLENNHRARQLYEQSGFHQASYTDDAGGALFFAKPLADSQPATSKK